MGGWVDVKAGLRIAYSNQKDGKDFGRVAIFNSVTLATRVRIEILWAIAKKAVMKKRLLLF